MKSWGGCYFELEAQLTWAKAGIRRAHVDRPSAEIISNLRKREMELLKGEQPASIDQFKSKVLTKSRALGFQRNSGCSHTQCAVVRPPLRLPADGPFKTFTLEVQEVRSHYSCSTRSRTTNAREQRE